MSAAYTTVPWTKQLFENSENGSIIIQKVDNNRKNHQVDLQTGELADLLGFDKDINTTASYGTNEQTSQDWWPYFKTQICWNCDLKLSYLELDIYSSE